MRFQKNLALCLAFLAVRAAFAEEPVPAGKPEPFPNFLTSPSKTPATDADKTLPLGDPIPRPTATPSLLPDEIPTNKKRPADGNSPGGSKPGAILKPQAAAADLDLRIRFRNARNVAEANEQVRAAWDDSRGAKTDHEKRQALKRYYDLLFAKMLGVDRGIAALVEQRRKTETAALTQRQIAPTVATE